MKIRISKNMLLYLLLVLVCIISIPPALSMYREKQTKTLKATVTHPNYTVTADANGGSIPATTGWTGTGATATKTVTYGHEYGTLPTPTRTGYTFQGWNGKNIVNFNNLTGITSQTDLGSVTLEAGIYTISSTLNNNSTIPVAVRVLNNNKTQCLATSNYIGGNTNGSAQANFVLNENQMVYIAVIGESQGYNVDVSNIQLEVGSTATAYEPYYVTSSVNVTQAKNHTLKARWQKKTATLLPGQQFNVKIKQLAGNQDVTYETENLNITSIVRSNNLTIMPTDANIISTSDSEYPIYAWFDSNNGTLYYYTEALNPYMNSNSGNMFRNLKNLTSLDLSEFDTKYTTYMHAMFYNCLKLSSLNISNFYTSNVTNMGYMFGNCKKLVTLDLSNFDMSRVTSVEGMFNNFGNPSELQTLKTPKVYPTDSNVKITLPKTMIDASGNEYTEINNTNQTETMLYTPATFIDGWKFNLRIKQLAGNQIETYGVNDNNIRRIVRSNNLTIMPIDENVVSTTDSYTPIYVWFDSNDGTIYYYTEAEHPYMNANAHSMFRQLVNATSIDLSTINTSKSTNMAAMFHASSSLANLDLSTFNMSGITTSEGVYSMLGTLNSLQSLKTPKVYPTNNNIKIALQKILVDSSGNEYTQLDNTSPTETLLFIPATFLPGSQFNIKLKKLANPTLDNITAYTEDTNITSIQRSNTLPNGFVPTSDNTISTSNSYKPIYAWFDNGTIYYYTEAVIPYTNETMYQMFYNLDSIETINLSGISTKKTTNMSTVFVNCNNLHTITLDNNFDSSNVTHMGYMFYNSPITTIDLTKINTSKVTNMSYMFAYTHISNPNLSSFNTSNVEDMSYMFYGNVYSSTMTFGSNFVTSKVSNMEGMFGQCTYLTSLDLSGFNTSNVVNMSKMFYNVSRNTSLSLDLSNFNTSKVTNMSQMFFYTQLTSLDISSFDMSLVADTTNMFTGVDTITQLKTPNTYPSEAVIQLPKTLYQANGNAWTVLDSSAPTETWLKLEYIPYSITYNLGGGTASPTNPTSYNINSNAITLNNPTRSGYAFAGWSGGKEIKQGLPSDTAAANTTSRTFTTPSLVKGLAFNNYYYPSNVSSYSINNNSINIVGRSGYGIAFALLCEPNTDYTISYASIAGEGASPVVGIAYYAQDGSLIKYRVNQSSGNQSLTSQSSSDSYYVVISFGVNATSFASITYSNISLSGTTDTIPYEGYVDKQTTLTIPSGSTGNRVYTANWTPIDYEIQYDLQGGTLVTQNPTGYNADSETFTLNNPTLTGYTFLGWTGSNGNTPQTTVTISSGSTGDRAYIANWRVNSYTVTADANGGTIATTSGWTGTGATSTKSVTYDSQYGTLPTPTRNGYTFNGWTYGVNFTGVTGPMWVTGIADSSLVSTTLKPNTTYKIEYDVTLNETIPEGYTAAYTGQWGNIGFRHGTSSYTYQIANGGSLYSKSGSNYEVGRKYHLFATITTPSDLSSSALVVYTAQAKSSNNNLYNIFGTFSNIVFYEITDDYGIVDSQTINKVADNHAITANWNLNRYKITYDLQGGSLADSNPTTYFVYTPTFTLNNPTLTGYTFLGWTGSNGNTPQTTVTIPSGSTGDKAYIANWQANTYDVTFDTNGGTIGANSLFSFDGSTHTIDGTINGATWGTDYLQFAGNSSSYVDLGQINSDYMTLQTTFSVDETVTTGQVIIGNVESGGACIAVTQSTDDYVIMGTAYINNEYRRIYSNVVPEVGKKYNVLLSYDGKVLKLFIDNNLAGSIEIEGTIGAPIANTVMVLGGNPLGSDIQSQYFKGKIYSASIYSNPKKQVTYDSPYGTLPNPTRNNYIFRGWNGKNILNIPDKNISFTNAWYSQEPANPKYIFKPSTDYTLTFDYDINLTDTYLSSVGYGNTTYSKDIRSLGYSSTNAGKMVFRFTTPETFDYDPPYAWFRFVRRSSSGDADVDISNIQLEEGSNPTPYEPYYVTSSTTVIQTKNHTLKAIWDLKESTFLPGQQFNAKIKQLAGNQDATYESANTNITSIVRSNSLTIMPTDDNVVSTSDSNTPTYAWFDNNSGTLYYYTDAVNLYMNSSAPYMFYNLRNATNIDLDDINTTKTTSMYGLFHSCINLSNLDLSNFDTSNVISARAMFAYDNSLTSLDLSNFNLEKVNDVTFIFEGMTSLKSLKTPSVYPTDSSVKITLPKLMVDASGNEYTQLDNTSPIETMLYASTTFIPGNEFNAKIKQLAGNTDATYSTTDTNITSILRSNTLSITPTSDNVVSTSDSYYPIYAWFNNGTLYYYSESQELYMNSYAYAMFRNLTKVVSIDLSDINTKLTTEMSTMFLYDDKLATLDLSNFDTSNVRQMQSMFHSCASLQELDLSSFDLTSITNSGTMFNGMTSLKRLKTPEVIPTGKTVALSKLLVDVSGNEYTELNSTTSTETWLYVPATFLPGTEYNAKIKQLAGNNGATYETENTNITSIVRTNTLSITPTSTNIVSTSDSYYPIYAWYNNGVIYYYSEANNLYMNKTSTRMFTNLKSVTGIDLSTVSTVMSTIFYELFYNDINLESIDVSHFNTSNVTDMQRMFRNCNKIETLNLSNFNTSKVTDMRMMFSGCSSLETLNISSFRTPNVVYMNGMFTYTKLQTLDLSNFDMTKVTNTTDMLRDMSELEQFKTPNTYPSEAVIQMPQTLYDLSGNSWTVLDSSAPTETWLKLEYIPYSITYNLGGGTASPANPTSYNINNNSITLNNPTRNGYTFLGWTEENDKLLETTEIPLREDPDRYYGPYYKTAAGYYRVDIYGTALDEVSNFNAYEYSTENVALVSSKVLSSTHAVLIVQAINDATTRGIEVIVYKTTNNVTVTKEEIRKINNSVVIATGTTGNKTYIANWQANSYTVIADANGGSIPSTTGWTGTGNTATKSVTYNSQYGTLPTPTRNGYTFKGWNGKNLFDSSKGENGYILDTGDISNTQANYLSDYIEVDSSKTYTLSGNVVFYNIGIAYYDSNKEFLSRRNNYNKQSASFTPQASGYIRFWISLDNSTALNSELISSTYKVQLEEGSSATLYEPYYVTSSTQVKQDHNHTLKAKWEMNTYEIQYDLQSGTLANSNPATYNVETQTFTLNNPTLTGQTFIGWTGSNGNTPEVNVTIPVGSYGDKAYVAHFSPIYEPETRIRSLNTIGTSIADDDPDSNLRFIGSNPSNYVSFNGQKWRIIGVFNGKLKIIQDPIGSYSWDTSRNTVNNGNGVNQWGPSGTYTGADLMKLLNPGYSSNTDLKCNTTISYTDGIYNCGDNTDSNYTSGLVNNSLWWNAESGYCYDNGNYSTTACDFTTTGLQSNTARNMIDNATWYLGSNPKSDNIWDGRLTASYLYNMERSNNSGKQCSSGNYCSDDVTRTTTWQGKVGLLYPSDYVYATSGGTTHNRNTCLTVHSGYVESNSNVQNWSNTYTDCKNNDWLLNSYRTWSLSPSSLASYSTGVFLVNYGGHIYRIAAVPASSVRPVVYLKSSIKFTTGDGSFNSPFNLIDTE